MAQKDPADRILLQSIASHPFFDPNFPTHSLDTSAPSKIDTETKKRNPEPILSQMGPAKLPPFPRKVSFVHNRGRHSDVPPPSTVRRKFLGDNGNGNDLRCLLREEISSNIGMPRRIVSDPLPRNQGSLVSELPTWQSRCDPTRGVMANPSVYSADFHEEELDLKLDKDVHASSFPDTGIRLSDQIKGLISCRKPRLPVVLQDGDIVDPSVAPAPDVKPFKSHDPTAGFSPYPVEAKSKRPSSKVASVDVPVGTTHPSPFSTRLLKPQTHKSVYGQLTILPSRSLLVDFREGERRRGKKGDYVFVIDPDGVEVCSLCYHSPITHFEMYMILL
jgi:polo-like kinase 4